MSYKLKKRILSAFMVICIIISSAITVFAGPTVPITPGGGGGGNNNGTSNANGFDRGDATPGTGDSNRYWGIPMDDKGQGLRVYCTDDNGKLIISDYGTSIYDCMYPDKKTPSGRQLVYASGSANTGFAKSSGNRYSLDKSHSTDVLREAGRSTLFY